MKTVYLICNAHIDPVWQWEWEEGAAEALSTFRTAADLCEEFDGFVFNHNEAMLYRWIEEYEPQLFSRIQRLVRVGRWHIMGGWYLQPDCNMLSGESHIRQIESGLRYFKEKFGARPKTAIGFDAFGHTRGLVQILKKTGFDSYLFCRPWESFQHLPEGVFDWVGYDGSRVTAKRINDSYSSPLGKAAEKIEKAARRSDCPIDVCLWGVGDHGGGPSRKDLRDISELTERLKTEGILLPHSTPEQYFAAVKDEPRPEHIGDLNPWAPGCYTSQIQIKLAHRRLENGLFSAEKLCSSAAASGLSAYPTDALAEAQTDLMTVQFHDMLPGTCVQNGELSALRQLSHGEEIISRVRARAFFALSAGQEPAAEGEIPIIACNPHPYTVKGSFSCEMSLWDQNWEPEFSMPQVFDINGVALPTQCEKEASNLNLDWRKRVVFSAELPPMTAARFNCRYNRLPKKPVPSLPQENGRFVFKGDRITASVNLKTGCLDSYISDGISYLKPGAFSLGVIEDDGDPWGMLVTEFPKKCGKFRVMTPKSSGEFSGASTELEGVRVIEDGAVRTVVEAVLSYRRSRAVVQYILSKSEPYIDIQIRLQWMEIQRMVKLHIPTEEKITECIGQQAFGEESFDLSGRENVSGCYLVAVGGDRAVGIINNGVLGSSVQNSSVGVTLIRSPAYCAHPISPDRSLIPQDRFTPHTDQGERIYRFRIVGGETGKLRRELPRMAESFSQPPMLLSFFPAGGGSKPKTPLRLTGDPVTVSAFKHSHAGNGYILRLFNCSAEYADAALDGFLLSAPAKLSFAPYEVKTFLLENGNIAETDMADLEI